MWSFLIKYKLLRSSDRSLVCHSCTFDEQILITCLVFFHFTPYFKLHIPENTPCSFMWASYVLYEPCCYPSWNQRSLAWLERHVYVSLSLCFRSGSSIVWSLPFLFREAYVFPTPCCLFTFCAMLFVWCTVPPESFSLPYRL